MAESVLDRKTCSAGETIFREGQEGNSAYIVESGKIDVFKNVNGEDVLIGSIGKGAIFGEMALIDHKPRMASARAAEATTCIVISRHVFEQKLAKTDPFVRGLLKIFAGQIRDMSQAKMDAQSAAEAAKNAAAVEEANAAAAVVSEGVD